MSTNKGCVPGKSSLIGLGSAHDYDGCAILQAPPDIVVVCFSVEERYFGA